MDSPIGWLDLAGHGALLQAGMIVAGTFVLEDATTVLTAMGVGTHSVTATVALLALYAGVILGDLGLYGLGYAAARTRLARRFVPSGDVARQWLHANLWTAVFVSRFVPGARLPTYTACGFLGADLVTFLAAVVVATLVWTTLLFAASLLVGQLLIDHLGQWRWVGMAGFAVTIVLLGRLIARQRTIAP